MAQEKENEDPVEFIVHMKGDIGVIASSSYVGFAHSMFPLAAVKEFDTWDDAVSAVVAGRILAAFYDELEIKKIIRARPGILIDVQTVVFKDAEDPIAMAVSWDNTHLLYWLNEYLEAKDIELDADKLLSEYSKILSSGKK